MARKLAAVVFSLGCIHASSVMALGLGELKLESFLNEPLKARVDLLNTGGLHEDEIRIRLATRDDFKKLGLDRAYFLTNIKFDVVVDDKGRAQIMMSSDDPVLEPYLDFIVEARWPSGRLLREYTVLIDPPVFADSVTSSPAVSASQRVEEVEGIPAPGKKKDGAAATSGTTVGLKKSDLPPGAMPQRDFSASTAPTPTAGSRYMISRDQTLWEIASLARPQGASVHQTMLDIQRLNPDAFINGNINRVKAGYIVYLPTAQDISSADLSAALAEVNEQNAAWREGRDAELAASSRPALRISAESGDTADTGIADSAAAEIGSGLPGGSTVVGSSAAAAGSDTVISEGGDAGERLVAMEQQLETMQRIVNLKDEKIAALQAALAESEATDGGESLADEAPEADIFGIDEEMEGFVDESVEESLTGAEGDLEEIVAEDSAEEELVEEEAATVETPAVASEEPSVARSEPAAADTGGGFMDYIYYVLGAVVLAVVGFIFVRRRKGDEDENFAPADSDEVEDLFSDVELQDEKLEVESPQEDTVEEHGEKAAADVSTRGYGQRRNDEYASDVEAADALAEADIYIAYGRHPQAIDLLTNALVNEPNNPVYRLKLIEIHTELNDLGAATAQFEQLRASGDAESITRAEVMLAALDDSPAASQSDKVAIGGSAGLVPNPLELVSDSGDSLEADFSDLEIEGSDDEGELDLSADFEDDADEDDDYDDEELVIADDANGLSTKMDLARAYLDMGDDDGARQILEEVVAEGSEELKVEARDLLDRIG